MTPFRLTASVNGHAVLQIVGPRGPFGREMPDNWRNRQEAQLVVDALNAGWEERGVAQREDDDGK